MRQTQETPRRWFSIGAAPEAEPVIIQRLRDHGFRWIQVADAAVLLTSMALISVARFGFDWPTYPLGYYAAGFLIATAIHLVVAYFGGLYEPEQRLGQRAWLPKIAALTLAAVLLDALAAFATGRYLMPRGNLVALAVVASFGLTANRHLSRFIRLNRAGPPRVLLVGTPDDVNLARKHLEGADDTEVVGESTTTEGLLARVEETHATDVLLLSGRALDGLFPEPLDELERRDVGVLQRIGAQDTLLGLRETIEVGGMPFVALRAHTLPQSRAHLKRVLELVALLVAAPLFLPLFCLVALYVRTVAGRGIFFRQVRVGRNGVPFEMLKFRTMYHDAEARSGAVLAKRRDPRVIPACRWLRDARFDELPQLWNVVKGDMSIVGPRPERPEFTSRFQELIPGYTRRHEIRPGITGLAQIHGKYHTDPSYKLGHDLQYLVNWSPILDLEIVVRTVWVVLRRRV